MKYFGMLFGAAVHLGIALFYVITGNGGFMVPWLAFMVGVLMLMGRTITIFTDTVLDSWRASLESWKDCQQELSSTLDSVRKYLESGHTNEDRIIMAKEIGGEERYAQEEARQNTTAT